MAQKRGCCEKLGLLLAEWVARTWCSRGEWTGQPASAQLGSHTELGWGGSGVMGDPKDFAAWRLGRTRIGPVPLSPACPLPVGRQPCSAHPSTSRVGSMHRRERSTLLCHPLGVKSSPGVAGAPRSWEMQKEEGDTCRDQGRPSFGGDGFAGLLTCSHAWTAPATLVCRSRTSGFLGPWTTASPLGFQHPKPSFATWSWGGGRTRAAAENGGVGAPGHGQQCGSAVWETCQHPGVPSTKC